MGEGTPAVLVLGIGNLLWADEGFGVRAVETLHQHYCFSDNVKVMDGGTQGVYLVQHIRDADILIVFDAVDYGLPPGTLKLVHGDEVPKFLGAKKISLHQTGFQEVLAMAEMLGDYPKHLLLIGVQPVELEDYGGSLRPAVKAQIAPAIDAALTFLEKHDVFAEMRCDQLGEDDTIASLEMTLGRYEGGRPDAVNAFRHGDSRVLAGDGWSGPDDFDAEVAEMVARTGEPR
ncbi:HyaD/HybD family hydrogenase maturation endopeptidase [Labrenzia sp. PHM005]|uniref:HyaD/HybD family hydrogenase maturation endopeptidase n=1 Tax=Labrenzia sp. PHM005 TaxID=2590016 RepID=UPI00114050EC|nr:HyaD/HybD family hydrogenase maturation endopeptidase [Labrenzia sp. PHM005]QDG78712.1 HyaD/HybD family hydrogenase maturation endopeptidase [Labrenzia sp. PHM005]